MSSKALAVAAWEALVRAQVSVFREISLHFPSENMSSNEYDVLFNLSRMPHRRARIRDLNPRLVLTQPSVSRLIDRLVARGFVCKETDPSDGRGTIVQLTEDGFNAFRSEAVVHSARIHDRVGSALTDDELRTLARLCDKLRPEGQ